MFITLRYDEKSPYPHTVGCSLMVVRHGYKEELPPPAGIVMTFY